MSKLKVYLAGCETWYWKKGCHYYEDWREFIENWFNKYSDNVEIINPCNYYNFDEKYHKTDAEIRRFDLHKVKHSDVILVNLDRITDSVGTLNEIFVADELGIPVVGFYEFNNDNDELHSDKYKEESWILDACIRIEDDETTAITDACNYINNYFAN